jgi:membrane protease YdiL (CAAX protease family)
MLKWQTVAVAYALLGSLAGTVAVAIRDGSPFSHPTPWLVLEPSVRLGSSLLLGVALAILLIASTRVAVQRWNWARKLHADLRPVAQRLTMPSVVTIAVLSSLGEELFFRGLLTPFLGIFAQAALFGLAHQVAGPSRWVWVGWAAIVGLAFGAIFALTGSLVGPLTAHALVNGYNLVFLRDHDPGLKPRRLGGLLASTDV